MSVFADYLDLRLAVAELVGRSDISDVMPRMVQAAEAFLNKKLRTRDQEKNATLLFTLGLAPLPSDFEEIKYVYQANGTSMFGAEPQIARLLQTPFSIVGNEMTIRNLNGVNVVILYYAKIPTLTSSLTATNWLLQKSPNLYLYAVGHEIAKWLKNPELVVATKTLLDQEMRDLNENDVNARYGNARVIMRSSTP